MVRTDLTREVVALALEECLRAIAGDKTPKNIEPSLEIARAWCLDSEHGVELACDLCTRLDIEIPIDDNPLIDDGGSSKKKHFRTFDETVDYLLRVSQN